MLIIIQISVYFVYLDPCHWMCKNTSINMCVGQSPCHSPSSISILSICVMVLLIVGRICNNFEKNRAFYDKSMKLGTWLVDNKTKKIRVSATQKMPSNGRHLVFSKKAAFFQLIHYNLII